MSRRTRSREKGRRESGSFIAIPHSILESPEYAALSAAAVKLLLDLFAQYNGKNNGDFSAAWRLMHKRGWRSRDTLNRARHELEDAGFITKTRQGWQNVCSLYGVTWKNIDECNGKLDVRPTATPSSAWKKSTSTPVVSPWHGSRVNGARL